MRGFSTIEIVLALALMCVTLSAVATVVFADQDHIGSARERGEALTLADMALRAVEKQSLDDFVHVQSTSTVRDSYTITQTVTALDDHLTKRVRVAVDWQDAYHVPHEVFLTTLVTDYAHALSSDTCDPVPIGNWATPRVAKSISLAGTIASIDAMHGRLFVTFAPTSSKAIPQTIVLDADTLGENSSDAPRRPQTTVDLGAYRSEVTINDVATHDGYAYAATNHKDAEVWVFDAHDPLTPRIAQKFDASGSFGVGKSVFVQDDLLYLGKAYESGNDELQLFKITPASGQVGDRVGSYKVGASVTDVLVRTNLAFVLASTTKATSGDQFRVLTVTDPSHITSLGSATVRGAGVSFDCEDNTFYVASNDAGHGYISIIEPAL